MVKRRVVCNVVVRSARRRSNWPSASSLAAVNWSWRRRGGEARETRVFVVVGYGGGDNLDGRDLDARLRPVFKVGGHVLGGRGQRPCPCRFGLVLQSQMVS